MNNEKSLIEHHIDPRCSVIKGNDTLIINLDHSPEADNYLFFIKVMSGGIILLPIFLLMKLIFEAIILLIVFLLIIAPLIIPYFFYRSKSKWVIRSL